ncbi:hypothetical protein C5167_011627 [Papaver somniferum]|uniref:UvrD-like helicase ATP-binding domain-containing protein n=1 Tax=Papaver somniferum TaxID=3469 RepID=A0A4Y7K528_PAPSO|nr:hypothetical protein C5167_011627 [Papaver somniferum]
MWKIKQLSFALSDRDLVVPITWRVDDEIVRYKKTNNAESVDSSSDGVSDGRCYIENSKVRDSLLLMKFYSLSAGLVNHLLSGSDGKELDLPFEVTDEELDIIQFPRSTFILGSFSSSSRASTEHNSVQLPDIDDAVQYQDIPDSLRDIPPESFPLVITFQKFLMMLDGTMGNSYFDRFNVIRELSQSEIATSRSFALRAFIRTKEVNYERFNSSYWPHFNCQLTKKLDSSMVFIEIISHIKGGLFAGRLPDDKLSREDYILLSDGRVSSLSRERREMSYDIFLEYEKKKVLHDEFDSADFVIDLHRRLKTGCYEGEEMDFVYIDEVQDLTMRQIGLFKYICRNFVEGFVFSGDTAQTIAGGVDFRFQDARSLFYNEFILDSGSDVMGNAKDMDPSRISDIYHLNQNFCTHAGVLNLSQSVIELLHIYFPHHIDNLSPETSLIYREAPIWLESANEDSAIITIFGRRGENAGRSMSGFGAEQVILVQNKSFCRMQGLRVSGNDSGLWMFCFTTFTEHHLWRVVYGYMKEQSLLNSNDVKFPKFNNAKHQILCSELKQLYVAITRTRQRLWICENIDDFSKPMFDYWKKLCLVQVRELDESLVHAMQVTSSKEEWSSRGIKLLEEGNFEMATMCFERAGDSFLEKLAKASGLRAAGIHMLGSNNELARVALVEAAEIYESIGKADFAAKCFMELKDYKRAGLIYLENCGESRLEDAGDCFSLAGCWSTAADVYSRNMIKVLYTFLLNSDACWRKEIEDRLLRKTRDLLGMNDHQFAPSARRYWLSTLLSLCMQVLEKLESLYKFSDIVKVGNDFFMHNYGPFRPLLTVTSEELYHVIIQRSDLSPAYNAFIKQLKRSKISGEVSVCLVSNFEKSLQEAFNHDWKNDHDIMSASWFVYFLERLLFFVSSWPGSFLTVKSSVYETIPWGNLRCNASSLSVADSKVFSRRFFDFIASKIKEILTSRLEWLWERDSDRVAYYPYLVCKLVLLVALICLNCGCHFDLLYSLLARYDIITVLPPVFAMILEKRGSMPNDKLLADILDAVGDPLVFLKSGDIQREFLSHSVFGIDVDSIHSREDIFGILYPEISDSNIDDEMEEIGNPEEENVCFSNFDHMGYSECPTESDDDMERAELEITKKFDLVKSSQLFTNTARVYMFWKRIFEDIPYHDCNPQMKLEICICYLHTEYPFSKELFSKYKDWMWELKQLSFALSDSKKIKREELQKKQAGKNKGKKKK